MPCSPDEPRNARLLFTRPGAIPTRRVGEREARATSGWRSANICRRRGVGLATLAALAAVALGRPAAADLTAAYDGALTVRRTHESASLAGALTQSGVGVSGTFALSAADAAASGVYNVSGRARGKKVVLVGTNSSGMTLRLHGRVGADGTIRGPLRIAGAGKRVVGPLSLTPRAPNDPRSTPPASCDNSFFTGQVMGRVLQPICANCHVPGGAAAAANFRVTAGDPLATQASVAQNIDTAHPDESRILLKPLNQLPHAGGQQLAAGSEEEQILRQWVNAVAAGTQCQGNPGPTVGPMVPIPPTELLVRASMDLRGKRPAVAELDAMEANPNRYGIFVDQYLHSREFLERVKDVYDDALLVRREDFTDEARDKTWALYSEALELIAYIVDNDRPFSELGTADYTVANQLFQSDPKRMPFPMEPVSGSAWQPTHYTDGRPHAGLLSTSAFYEVWDTNNTNKNRRRANRWSIVFHCYNFLDTPVDVTRNVDNNDANAVLNAVTTRADCKACHDKLDPMASFLFPMDNAGLEDGTSPDDFFSGDPERWRRANRRPPAVYGQLGGDIRDMGRLLVAHPKFAECQTKRAFKMLFLRDPKTNDELATAADIASRWPTEDGYNFRALMKRWMLSPVYVNRPQTGDADWIRRVSPERYETLIKDLTGFLWTRPPDDDEPDDDPNSDPPRTTPVPLLTNEEDGFKIILGGVNGVSVSARSQSLNASVAVVQRKLAALAADHVVEHDLGVPDADRALLAGVTGTENPAKDEAAIRATLARIARRLYGPAVAPDAPLVTVWFGLYRDLYADRTQGGENNGQVPGTPSDRAWRGVLTAMLRSPKILLY